jgi:hypothetical protein
MGRYARGKGWVVVGNLERYKVRLGVEWVEMNLAINASIFMR